MFDNVSLHIVCLFLYGQSCDTFFSLTTFSFGVLGETDVGELFPKSDSGEAGLATVLVVSTD